MASERAHNDNGGHEPSVAVRLGIIESLLNQVLGELRQRKRRAGKRVQTVAERAHHTAVHDPNYKPTELQVAAARRALARIEARRHR